MKKVVLFIIFLLTPFIVLALPKGDINGDNKVDSYDYALIRNHIRKKTLLTGNELKRADVDGQNGVDNRDYALIRNTIKASISSSPTPTVKPATPKATSTPKVTAKPTITPKATVKPTTTPTATPLTAEEKICESVKNNSSIDYKSFLNLSKKASNGDKYKDDYYAINAAHKCANKYNKPVVVTKGTYHIYKKNQDTITVQTNTDLSNSTIYIHDEEDIHNYMSVQIFTIKPNSNNKCTTGTKTGFTNAFTSLVPSSGKYFVYINELNGKQVYHRNKGNGYTEQEKAKRDPYRVYNGVVQDPIVWDYKNSTIEYTVCPIPSNQLVFKNATIKTVTKTNCEKCGTAFKTRGISVRRSNTKVYNIKHSFVNSKFENIYEITHKYSGFLSASSVADVVFEKCNIYALYSKSPSTGKKYSTYDMHLHRIANLTLSNVKMYEDNHNQMKDQNYWSAISTYECKNFLVENSYLNTVSAHTNVYNLTVKNTTLGSRGIIVAGTGDRKDNKMVLENVTWKYSSYLIKIRQDYGTTWNGSIKITNGVIQNASSNTIKVADLSDMDKNTKSNLVFGQPIYNPTKVTINGLKVNSSNVTKLYIIGSSKGAMNNYYMKHFQRKTNKNEETSISKKNIIGVKTVVNYAG